MERLRPAFAERLRLLDGEYADLSERIARIKRWVLQSSSFSAPVFRYSVTFIVSIHVFAS